MLLKGQTIVITGASGGIGYAIAKSCLTEGANVTIAARSKDKLEEARLKLLDTMPHGRVLGVSCDGSKSSDCGSLIQETNHQFGSVDSIVCAAGILGEVGKFDEVSLNNWHDVLQTNVLGTINMMHAVTPQMKDNGSGKIILFSGGGQGPQPRRAAYTASKGAIWRITESLGHELAEDKIFVNAIAPGEVNTKFLDDLIAAGPNKVGEKEYAAAIAQQESGGTSPNIAGKLAIWLLSEKGTGLYGKVLSAKWDHYSDLMPSEYSELNESEIFTMKRVIDKSGNTKWN